MATTLEQPVWPPRDDYDLAYGATQPEETWRAKVAREVWNLDVGGVKAQYVTRAILAGWMAFLVRMILRPPFDDIMYFCAVMFTLFALAESGLRLREALLTSACFHAFTAIGFFGMAVTVRFPELQLVFIVVYAFVLMSVCRSRLLAVLPTAYASIAVYLSPTWLVAIDNCLALGVCFLCSVFAIIIFPSAYRAMEQSCFLAYLGKIRRLFQRLGAGWQPEKHELTDYLSEITSLSSLVMGLAAKSGEGFASLAQLPPVARARFTILRMFSRGLALLRNFRDVKDEFLDVFPDTSKFLAEADEIFQGAVTEILTGRSGSVPGADVFRRWRDSFSGKGLSGRLAHYAYAFSNLANDLASLAEPPAGLVAPRGTTRTPFFSPNTRMWEALRFTIAIGVAYSVARISRVPHAEWTGMFVAFMYLVPQHGIVLSRIGKGIFGTCLGVALGFIMVETTMRYSYLWAWGFPIVALILLYVFALRKDFAIMMVGFACALMFAIIMGAAPGVEPNFFQALASRMMMALVAGLIVFAIELITFPFGSLRYDIRQGAATVFETMRDTLERHSRQVLAGTRSFLRGVDEIAEIFSGHGGIRMMREMIEFEIGFDPRLQRHYDLFLRHLNVCCLYQRKMFYLTNHPDRPVDPAVVEPIRRAVDYILRALDDSAAYDWSRNDVERRVLDELTPLAVSDPTPQIAFYVEALALFAKNLDETRRHASHIMSIA